MKRRFIRNASVGRCQNASLRAFRGKGESARSDQDRARSDNARAYKLAQILIETGEAFPEASSHGIRKCQGGRWSSSEDIKHSLTTFNETAVAPFQQHRDTWRSLMAQIWQLSCAVKLFSAEVTKMRVIMMTAAIYFGEPATGLVLLATSTRSHGVCAR